MGRGDGLGPCRVHTQSQPTPQDSLPVRSRRWYRKTEACHRQRGRTVHFGYDRAGYLSTVLLPHPDIHDEWVVHAEYAYSEAGDSIVTKDAEGATTKYAYDRRSHLMVQETNRNGFSFYWIYDGRSSGARCVRTWGDERSSTRSSSTTHRPTSPSLSIRTGTRPSTQRTSWD